MSPSVQCLKVISTFSQHLYQSCKIKVQQAGKCLLNTLDWKAGDKSQRRKGPKSTHTFMSVQNHPARAAPIWGDFSGYCALSCWGGTDSFLCQHFPPSDAPTALAPPAPKGKDKESYWEVGHVQFDKELNTHYGSPELPSLPITKRTSLFNSCCADWPYCSTLKERSRT